MSLPTPSAAAIDPTEGGLVVGRSGRGDEELVLSVIGLATATKVRQPRFVSVLVHTLVSANFGLFHPTCKLLHPSLVQNWVWNNGFNFIRNGISRNRARLRQPCARRRTLVSSGLTLWVLGRLVGCSTRKITLFGTLSRRDESSTRLVVCTTSRERKACSVGLKGAYSNGNSTSKPVPLRRPNPLPEF